MERLSGTDGAAPGEAARGWLLDALLALWVFLVFGLYAWRFISDWLAANLGRVAGMFT